VLPVVADAVWSDRLLAVRYRHERSGRHGPGGEEGHAEVRRELEPHGLVLKAGVWYVCARTQGEFRVYRVDRIVAAQPMKERFSRDAAFDLSAFWHRRSAQFARSLLRVEVVLRLTPAGAAALPYLADRAAAQEALAGAAAPDAGGLVTVTVPMESEDVAYGQVLGLGPEAEVLRPASLRARFAQTAHALAALYGRGSGR
jgi:predicted DNA-binding transcriptional regulator YafY